MRSALAVRLARAYVRWKVRRGLGGLFVAGLGATRARLAEGPVVFAATHVAWWDGLVMLLVDEALGAEGHVLLEAPTLARLPWLSRLGALPLDRADPMRARADLRAAAAVLDGPGRAVWIFPQGRQRPPWLRPLGIAPGVGVLARMSRAPVVPVALTYAFRDDAAPAALVHLGAPVPADHLEDALSDGLAAIDRFLDPTRPHAMSGSDAGPAPPDHGGGVAGGFTPPPQEAFAPLVAPPSGRADRGLGARLLARLGAT
ncbi:MAG: lysophospholipid acyltransferase family protein [Myxococcota bacterium]